MNENSFKLSWSNIHLAMDSSDHEEKHTPTASTLNKSSNISSTEPKQGKNHNNKKEEKNVESEIIVDTGE